MTGKKWHIYMEDPLLVMLEMDPESFENSGKLKDIRKLHVKIAELRLWKHECLTAKELRLLLELSNTNVDELRNSTDIPILDIESYIQGKRAMTNSIEKLIRIFIFKKLSSISSMHKDFLDNYLVWVFDNWKMKFRDASKPVVIGLKKYKDEWVEKDPD